ncbi:NADH dehydrogenase [ubiquinone] 1 alpha subcomplex subunit 8 [Brachionus plicatilis]|uniref:NADH dehydrogenase [ubiquinone] 1 alpha subcomplex subunit 8 n=1 Tax=Brachionus plicatilis TaxID=10195 RepID=A0A3M7R164_BRAPC|nr:NADH dehydrogenase [ubiquinone] 1 alpha subcomplex subunit 8 [Brachionus plicatilis]
MTATNETYLPTYEELYVPPINLTSSGLKAGAPYLGVFCDKESKEFMLCKAEEKDPRKCLDSNKQVSLCASKFFHQVRENCAIQFTNYWMCLDKAPEGQMSYQFCRKTQAELDKCMSEKMNLNRPEVGWMSKVKLHQTDRPKPVQKQADIQSLPEAASSFKEVPEALDSLKRTNNRAL